jgi:hypothetical protein
MAISTVNNMGIGPLGSATFKRKYRWTFRVDNIGGNPQLGVGGQYVKVANRPQLEVEETEINFLNGKTWIPGKATFQQLSVTYYDIASTDAAVNNLLVWVNKVYNFSDGNGEFISATQKNVAKNAAGDGYAGNGILTLLDGGGYALEEWRLINCWPVSINFGDLDYSSSEECTIELNMRYSFAKYTNYCIPVPPGTLPVPACPGGRAGTY